MTLCLRRLRLRWWRWRNRRDLPAPVYAVVVDGRMDGLYLFAAYSDQRRFADAVRQSGGDAILSEEPLHTGATANELVAAEREPLISGIGDAP